MFFTLVVLLDVLCQEDVQGDIYKHKGQTFFFVFKVNLIKLKKKFLKCMKF